MGKDSDKPEFTEDEVREFMDAKSVKITCELCDATDWLVFPDAETSFIGAVLVACGNCGNLRWHANAVVRKWKKAKEKTNG